MNNTEGMQIIIQERGYRKTLIRAFSERLSIVKNWNQSEMIMTVDSAEEILYLLKWQENEIESLNAALDNVSQMGDN